MQSKPNFAIAGGCGRMGRAFCEAKIQNPDLPLSFALTFPRSDAIDQDWGSYHGLKPLGIVLSSKLPIEVDVLIDFTCPEASLERLEYCAQNKIAMMIGTTGFDATQESKINRLSEQTAVLHAPNTSLGMALMRSVLTYMSGLLPNHYQIEIVETHHRQKKDAPSGTALALGSIFAHKKGKPLSELANLDRQQKQVSRSDEEIGFSSIRMGQVIGNHSVFLASDEDQIEISHRAHNRTIYTQGAIHAAKWLYNDGKGRKPGLYGMQDALT